MLQIDSYLEIAKSAALLAGAYIKDQQNKDLEILLNEGRDIKLQVDIDAEKIIKDHIVAKSSFPILAEESGASNQLNEFYWVVDPLDGTSNFLRNIPISCVSIALMSNIGNLGARSEIRRPYSATKATLGQASPLLSCRCTCSAQIPTRAVAYRLMLLFC